MRQLSRADITVFMFPITLVLRLFTFYDYDPLTRSCQSVSEIFDKNSPIFYCRQLRMIANPFTMILLDDSTQHFSLRSSYETAIIAKGNTPINIFWVSYWIKSYPVKSIVKFQEKNAIIRYFVCKESYTAEPLCV